MANNWLTQKFKNAVNHISDYWNSLSHGSKAMVALSPACKVAGVAFLVAGATNAVIACSVIATASEIFTFFSYRKYRSDNHANNESSDKDGGNSTPSPPTSSHLPA